MAELTFAICLALGGSFVCSLFEAVLYSVPVSHLEVVARSGSRAAKVMQDFRRNVDAPIAAILSLNTIAHTIGAAVAGAAVADLYGHDSLGLFSVVFTLAILVLSEVIPKTLGVVYARGLSTAIARPLQWMIWGMAPLVWLCRSVTGLIGGRRSEPGISEDELDAMARLGSRSGTVDPDKARAIRNILALESQRVRDVMTPRTVVFSLQASLSVGEVLAEHPSLTHARIPVWEDNAEEIVGVVLRRDILLAGVDNRHDVPLADLARTPNFVVDSLSLDRALQFFLERQEHLAIVIDEFGGLAGVLTLEDVLEEMLGREIVDEYDEAVDMRELARRRRRQALEDLTGR